MHMCDKECNKYPARDADSQVTGCKVFGAMIKASKRICLWINDKLFEK